MVPREKRHPKRGPAPPPSPPAPRGAGSAATRLTNGHGETVKAAIPTVGFEAHTLGTGTIENEISKPNISHQTTSHLLVPRPILQNSGGSCAIFAAPSAVRPRGVFGPSAGNAGTQVGFANVPRSASGG